MSSSYVDVEHTRMEVWTDSRKINLNVKFVSRKNKTVLSDTK